MCLKYSDACLEFSALSPKKFSNSQPSQLRDHLLAPNFCDLSEGPSPNYNLYHHNSCWLFFLQTEWTKLAIEAVYLLERERIFGISKKANIFHMSKLIKPTNLKKYCTATGVRETTAKYEEDDRVSEYKYNIFDSSWLSHLAKPYPIYKVIYKNKVI